MYVPKAFAVDDLPTLHDFIDRQPFGLLISQSAGRSFGSHIPFLLDRTTGPHGTLIAHVARANPQWKDLADQEALAVFTGPHAYLSPTWYAEPRTVPTWNYTAVHVYGRVEVVHEPREIVEFVRRLTASMEGGLPEPWTFDPGDPFVVRLAEGIVGLRIQIAQLEGKFKLNQNHPAERRARVIASLESAGVRTILGSRNDEGTSTQSQTLTLVRNGRPSSYRVATARAVNNAVRDSSGRTIRSTHRRAAAYRTSVFSS